jgi:peptidoglycan/xylan/chitin deacetylase (PgdA/CDA1 family)
MDESDRHGLTSAFYFICGRTAPGLDADYEPEHPVIRELMRRIHARGHEIGLHPSYNTYQHPEAIVAEARRLRAVTDQEGIHQAEWGGRMHFLRWEHPSTMNGWNQAGMDYDSTLSYADRPGFRCGTCFEYPAFDPVAQRALNLRIRPLIAMECTVMAPRYMGLGIGEAAFAKFKELKDACRAVGGCFTLLWHNSQFDSAEERALYRDVLSA